MRATGCSTTEWDSVIRAAGPDCSVDHLHSFPELVQPARLSQAGDVLGVCIEGNNATCFTDETSHTQRNRTNVRPDVVHDSPFTNRCQDCLLRRHFPLTLPIGCLFGQSSEDPQSVGQTRTHTHGDPFLRKKEALHPHANCTLRLLQEPRQTTLIGRGKPPAERKIESIETEI